MSHSKDFLFGGPSHLSSNPIRCIIFTMMMAKRWPFFRFVMGNVLWPAGTKFWPATIFVQGTFLLWRPSERPWLKRRRSSWPSSWIWRPWTTAARPSESWPRLLNIQGTYLIGNTCAVYVFCPSIISVGWFGNPSQEYNFSPHIWIMVNQI